MTVGPKFVPGDMLGVQRGFRPLIWHTSKLDPGQPEVSLRVFKGGICIMSVLDGFQIRLLVIDSSSNVLGWIAGDRCLRL